MEQPDMAHPMLSLQSSAVSSPVLKSRATHQSQCEHCHLDDIKKPFFESPFQGIGWILRVFQALGIFNFTIHDDYQEFECQHRRIFYALFLNVVVWIPPGVLIALWISGLPPDITWDVFVGCLTGTFSSTDFVAFLGLILFVQSASLGIQFNNMHLCGNLNDLVHGVRNLGVIDGYSGVIQNPRCAKKSYTVVVTLMVLISFTLIVSTIPEMIGLSIDRRLDLLIGITGSLPIGYLHLPQILSEFLFLRFMTVLEYHFEHLLGHIDCCMVHKNTFTPHPEHAHGAHCCLNHCDSLIKLFKTVEETFSHQLLILFALIMVSLIFSLYLSITFIISYRNWMQLLFILGFFTFSLVPAGRLICLASSVDRVIKKVEEVKQRLYQIESFSTDDLDVQGRVRCTIRKYDAAIGFSADNYFMVNHGMVTSILGYLTTYLIVLIQFKIAERSHL